MSLTWPFKDPDEVADYQIDWRGSEGGPGRLWPDDTILSSSWIVPTGIVKDSDSHTTTLTTIWLSGGTIGTTYQITNRVVTAGGRTWDQTVKIKIKAK